jgi:hypothetical protein
MLPGVLALFGLAAALILVMQFPPVVGLGTLVRLPVFHGALTWANFMLFAVMGVLGLVIFFGKKAGLYSWSKALRYTAIALWIFNFFLGVFTSSVTWDFTGSSQPAIMWMMQEPRIRLQFAVSMLGIAVLILPLIFNRWRTFALFDGIYGLGTLVMVYIAMNFGESLHPSNPVMSSDEAVIRITFLAMCLALVMMSSGLVMMVRTLLLARLKTDETRT